MNEESKILAYIEALTADTLLRVLTPEERTLTCQYRAGIASHVPKRVKKLQAWVLSQEIQPPQYLYVQEDEPTLYWIDPTTREHKPLSEHPLVAQRSHVKAILKRI